MSDIDHLRQTFDELDQEHEANARKNQMIPRFKCETCGETLLATDEVCCTAHKLVELDISKRVEELELENYHTRAEIELLKKLHRLETEKHELKRELESLQRRSGQYRTKARPK